MRWITTDLGAKTPTTELLRQLYLAKERIPNFNQSGSFQFIEEFNDPKYREAIDTIHRKYIDRVASGEGWTGTLRNKEKLEQQYLKTLYEKELPEFLK